MRLLKLGTLLIFVTLASCDSLNPFASKQEKMKNLEGTWYLQKYEADGLETELTEQEETNYLELKTGKKFECLENGKSIEGDWDYYMMSETISLMEDGEWECVEFNVVEATEDQLIYENITEDGTRMKVWMTSSPTSVNTVSPN